MLSIGSKDCYAKRWYRERKSIYVRLDRMWEQEIFSGSNKSTNIVSICEHNYSPYLLLQFQVLKTQHKFIDNMNIIMT